MAQLRRVGSRALHRTSLWSLTAVLYACSAAVPEPKGSTDVAAQPLPDSGRASAPLGVLAPVRTSVLDSGGLDEQPVLAKRVDGSTAIGPAEGQFDPRRVERAIRSHSDAIQACYERELRRQPDLSGKLTVQFTIRPGGRVRTKTLRNSTGSRAVARCVVRQLRRMRFSPGPKGGRVRYEYPFVFGA